MEKTINLEDLKTPFKPKWRVQSVKNSMAICVPYLDARQVQQRLDEVCGAANWQNNYDAETGVSSLAIKIEGEWIWKSDVGTESNVEKEKGKASDAFKRAAVLWGIGRNIYAIGTKVIKASGKYAATEQGQTIYTGDQLTDYINGLSTSQGLLMQIVKQNMQLKGDQEYEKAIKTLLAKLNG